MYRRLIRYNKKIQKKNTQQKMSITISNCEQICKDPSNSSPSKMLYSFPKGERFPKSRKTLCDKFYDSSFVEAARSTTFGFGHKYDFSQTTRLSPPVNAYHLKSEFDQSPNSRKGFGFGKGREEMKVTGPLVETLKNKNPAPGSYKLPSTLEKLSYSFTSRQELHSKQKAKIPGPGYYPVTLATNEKGRYPVSKIRNVLVRNFSTTLGRINTLQNKIPAPGAYDVTKASFSPDGKYCLSKMQNSKVRKFGTSLRGSLGEKKQTPGPGNYKLPSEFGHYISSKFRQSTKKLNVKEQKENIQTVVQ